MNTDTRLIELADILAGQIRVALDAYEAIESETLSVEEEGRRGDAIMAASEATVAEMLTCKPSTFLGFAALEMAARWAVGETFGQTRE